LGETDDRCPEVKPLSLIASLLMFGERGQDCAFLFFGEVVFSQI
jgi:hypothetical protein